MRKSAFGMIALAAAAAALASWPADGAGARHAMAAKPAAKASPQTQCTGAFSNGNAIDIASPVNQVDVGFIPGSGYGQKPPFPPIGQAQQTGCDVETFAWNQFLYLTSSDAGVPGPRFMHMAPWYNALKVDGSPQPGPYPGGSTALETAMLDQGQAGNDNHLLDVNGNTVRYDIRFDKVMYNAIVEGQIYTQKLFMAACGVTQPTAGACPNENTTKVWLPPTGANELPEQGAVEVKTAWRDFGPNGVCPPSYYCQGRFGLVGFHYVNKMNSHGEWVWATFEHVANDPDCTPGGDQPISGTGPNNMPWAFFNPKTVPQGVMSSRTCKVSTTPPQCNTNPKQGNTWVPINVCRTISAAAGGASTANCAVSGTANVAGNISCLNATILPKRSGPWANYKLVGAVWAHGQTAFMTNFYVVGFQQPIPGFQPAAPVGIPFLANTTMETWFQHASSGYRQLGATVGNGGADAGCFLCHNLPSSFSPHNRQMDLSHFPGKLPSSTLTALKASLIPANSRAVAPK
ncbi:MAG TPA: hypothetical protein VMH86_12835 [Rhizomicrobium sp.]|nr:hypothetical protein [Rhizomicrobium sp.]